MNYQELGLQKDLIEEKLLKDNVDQKTRLLLLGMREKAVKDLKELQEDLETEMFPGTMDNLNKLTIL